MPMVMPQCTRRLAALTPVQTLTVKVSERVLSCDTKRGLPFLHDIWPDDCDQQPHPPYKKNPHPPATPVHWTGMRHL